MANLSQTFAAGQTVVLNSAGDFVRIQTGVGLRLAYIRKGQQVGGIDQVGAGYSGKVPAGFDVMHITNPSGSAQLVELVTEDGIEHKTDAVTGTVQLVGAAGIYSDSVATIGTTAAVLFAANASRKALIMQNRDPVGNVWLRFGTNPTAGTGLLIAPGQTLILDAVPASNDVRAISDVAACAFYAAEA